MAAPQSRKFPRFPKRAQPSLRRLRDLLEGFDAGAKPWTVLATLLLDRTRIAARLATSADVIDRGRGHRDSGSSSISCAPSLPGEALPSCGLLDRVRRLVRLADERDLRQLPAAAQGIDAVRLMTIHGAKGLEFPVVHVPGMNADTLPRTPPAPPCPPPDGMVEGGKGSALEVFREDQAEEQECLFYVALSRARDRLFLYCPTQKSNGHNRPASPFLDRLGAGLARKHDRPRPIATGGRRRPPDCLDIRGQAQLHRHRRSRSTSPARGASSTLICCRSADGGP